ncbi:biliverdin-producing heme oxygenase [Pseudoalteromonas sp. D15MCD-2]|uniref:biliverdin-producing heme oxygenase n=1 Tax=Pseudoalteromonas TaxID=53246 RepID=UPI001EFE1FDE|nr:biliverdin-producing heme oxygenase [Pseudoalteromonas shioyasakiensis]MCG9734837.1 biliverdin-producing heme oxygenase [Pseudoalteromonas shioyasakiensis]
MGSALSNATVITCNSDQNNIHTFIKNSTDSLHSRVEKQLGAVLFDKNMTQQSYLEILIAMHSSYSIMEGAISTFSATKKLLVGRSKLSWLNQDIAYLQTSQHAPSVKLYKHDDLKNICNVSHAFGMMYVMEGATMGGGHIFKALKKHNWINELEGIRFFYSYGELRNQKWAQFIHALKQYHNDNPNSADDILLGANKAFSLISQALGDIN